MPNCLKCGTPLLPEERFCPSCGTPVTTAPAGLAVGNVLSRAFDITFKNLGTFIGAQLPFILAAAVATFLYGYYLLNPVAAELTTTMVGLNPEDPEAFTTLISLMGRFILITLGNAAISGFLYLLAGALGIMAADLLARGEKPSVGSVWSHTKPRLGNYLATSVLLALALFGVLVAGFATFFLLVTLLAAFAIALWLYTRWYVAGAASLLERNRPIENLKRSSTLTKGNRWRIVGIFLLLILVAIAVTAPLGIIAALASGQGLTEAQQPGEVPSLASQIAASVANLVGMLIVLPLSSTVIALVYRDLAGISAPPPPPPPAPAAGQDAFFGR